MKKRATFIGRFQPFHKGHEWLFNNKLKNNIPLLVLIRDILPDENNPLTPQQSKTIIEKRYKNEDVIVMIIPDIESINWGRGVGYETNQYNPPDNIKQISATSIRNKINNNDQTWKEYIDESIHHLIKEYLQ